MKSIACAIFAVGMGWLVMEAEAEPTITGTMLLFFIGTAAFFISLFY